MSFRIQRTVDIRFGRLFAFGFALLGVMNAHVLAQTTTNPARRTLGEVPFIPVPASAPADKAPPSDALRERIQAARDLLNDGKVIEALNRAESALNLPDGECYDVLYQIAYCKTRLGRSGEARVAAERAASMRPGAADVHYLLGLLYEEQARRALPAGTMATSQPVTPIDENWEKAVTQYRTATLALDREVDNPRVTASWYRLAECLNYLGDWPAAVEAYARFDETIFEDSIEHRNAPEVASALQESPLGGLEKRVSLLQRLNRPDDAVKVTREAVERWPNDAFVRRFHVRTLMQANRAKDAFAFVREMIETSAEAPGDAAKHPDGPLTLAIEAAKAAGELERWVSEVANDATDGIQVPLAIEMAGRLANAGAGADAIRLYRAIGHARPDDADVAWGLATCLRNTGGVREALSSLIEFVRHCATSPNVSSDDFLGGARLNDWMASFSATREALSMIDDEAKNSSADFATYYVLGITAAAAEQYELANRLLAAGIQQRPAFLPLHLAAARAAIAAFDWETAKQHAAAALQVDSASASANYLNAEALAGLDEVDAADAAYKQALQIAEARAGESGAGRGAAQLASDIALAFARFQLQLADRGEHFRDWQIKSQRYYQQAIALQPTNAEAFEGLIESYVNAGKVEVARSQLTNAERGDLPDDVLRRLRTSLRFAASMGSDEHVAELQRQWNDYPTDYTTGFKLILVLFARERYDDAERVLERVRLLRPLDDGVLGWGARLASRRLENDKAITQIEALRKRYPNRPSVLYPLSNAYMADFRVDEARDTLRRMLAISDDKLLSKAGRQQLLQTMELFGEFDAALEQLAAWRKDAPNDDYYRDRWYDVMFEAGRSKEAMEEATKSLEELPNDPSRRQWFLKTCINAKAYRVAEERIREWTPGGIKDFETIGPIVELLIEDGRASEAYDLVKDMRPNTLNEDAQRREWMGRCDLEAGRIDDGIAEYEALMETQEGRRNADLRIRAQLQIADALRKAGRFDDALARVEKELTALPTSEVQLRYAVQRMKLGLLYEAGRQDEYLQVLEQLRDAFPSQPGLNNDLGYSLVDANRDIDRGMKMIARAVAEEPLSEMYLDSLGWAYYKKGDFATGHKYLSRAARLFKGRDGVIYDHLGDVCYRLGDKSAARQAWEKSLEFADAPDSRTPEAERTKLHAAIRAKLAALDQNQPAPVAKLPTETP